MAFSQDINSLVTHFQERIDWLIDSAGKTVTLYFKKDATEFDPEDAIEDPIRGPVIKKPFFKPNGQNEEYTTSTLKALIKHNPVDFKRFNLQINDTTNIIRLKTYMTYIPNLVKCTYIVVPTDSENLIFGKYKIIREPTTHGLKDSRYCYSYWERVI